MKTAHVRSQGFTLIETLIALIITSMLAGLLVSALFFAARTQSGMSKVALQMFEAPAARHKFQYVLAHCLAASASAKENFIGSADRIDCFSLQSLSVGEAPAPVRIQWSLIAGGPGMKKLMYRDEWMPAGEQAEIASFPERSAFRYWSSDAAPSASWPPSANKRAWIPQRIEILDRSRSEPVVIWGVTLGASGWPEPTPPSVFGLPLR